MSTTALLMTSLPNCLLDQVGGDHFACCMQQGRKPSRFASIRFWSIASHAMNQVDCRTKMAAMAIAALTQKDCKPGRTCALHPSVN